MKVYLTSCETGEGAWRTHEQKLTRLYELSDKRYQLTDTPETADIILVGNVREENWAEKILQNSIIRRFPEKSFSLSDRAEPLILHHGIYTATSRGWLYRNRVRTGAYTLYPDEYINPHIARHTPSAGDYDDKRFLFSFVGRRCHPIRDRIFDLQFGREDVWIEDSSHFNVWGACQDEKLQRQRWFYQVLLASEFSLCPRGASPNSIRLFESMQLGVAPIIVTDDWIFPRGPDWKTFSIVVQERDLENLASIVQSYEPDHVRMGQLARRAYEEYFCERVYFNYVVENCLDIAKQQKIPESLYWGMRHVVIWLLKTKRSLRVKSRIRALVAR